MSDEEIDKALAGRKPDAVVAFAVWEENVPMLDLFTALETQWRVAAGFAVIYLGIDYASAEALMRARRVKDRAQAFADLRVMERAAARVLNRPADVVEEAGA